MVGSRVMPDRLVSLVRMMKMYFNKVQTQLYSIWF